MPTLSASPCACVGTRSGSPASLTLPSKRTWLSPPSTHTLILARKTNNLYSSSCVSSVQNARVRLTYLSLSPAISPMLRYVTCESGGPAPGSRSRSRRVEPDKRNRGTPNLLSLSEPSNFGRDHCTGFCPRRPRLDQVCANVDSPPAISMSKRTTRSAHTRKTRWTVLSLRRAAGWSCTTTWCTSTAVVPSS